MKQDKKNQLLETNKRIGAALRSARTLANISQAQLGKTLGISFQQIQKYETGSNRISAVNLVYALKAMEIDSSVFFSMLEEDYREHEKNTHFCISLGEGEIIRQFRKIKSETGKEALIKILKEFLKAEET